MSNYANDLVTRTIEEKIEALHANTHELRQDNDHHIKAMEETGIEVTETREKIQRCERIIEAHKRYVEDRIKNVIEFGNDRIQNNNWCIEENGKLIEELKNELSRRTLVKHLPEPVPASAPTTTKAKRTFTDLTPERMRALKKEYGILLKLKGANRYEYVLYLKDKGFNDTQTSISVSLGQHRNWLSQLVSDAKRSSNN